MKYVFDRRWLATACSLWFLACGAAGESGSDPGGVKHLRQLATGSSDPAETARWLLAELLEPGGSAREVARARKQLDALKGRGLRAHLARGLDDAVHGHFDEAPSHFLNAAKVARTSSEAEAPLLARFALIQALSLSVDERALWKQWRPWVVEALAKPGNLGWRARDRLAHWWVGQRWAEAESDVESEAARMLGCVQNAQFAGPFGSGESADRLRAFSPEHLDVWPGVFPTNSHTGRAGRLLKAKAMGCSLSIDESTRDGVFYVQTFVNLKDAGSVIVAAQGALKLWVDGQLVLDRDPLEWGVWTKGGVGLVLSAGEHRVVAKLFKRETSLRILGKHGVPRVAESSGVRKGLPVLARPQSFEVNQLRAYVRSDGVNRPKTPLLTYASAFLSLIDGEAEAASMLLEPLVKNPKQATGPTLSMAASIVARDAIFGEGQTKDLMRELHEQALVRDPKLWKSQLSRVSHIATTKGLGAGASELRKLTQQFQRVPALLSELGSVYGQLGWKPEHERVVFERAKRFPFDTSALFDAARLYQERGEVKRAEALRIRIRKLDPDSQVFVGLALERRNYSRAMAELKRLKQRRPARMLLERRLQSVERMAAGKYDAIEALTANIAANPREGALRRALFDAHTAAGAQEAAASVLAEAAMARAELAPVMAARDLLEAATELEGYRLDGRKIISDYEAAGVSMAGTAARVLDYMAVWVRADGSSRLLEHEIIRIQSEEAISRMSEQKPRSGFVQNMRVIKADGRILAPEPVPGKPTLTFPHLEVGDYIETEQIIDRGPTGGEAYEGPQWFFREKDIAYARSEFVMISPANKSLEIETTGEIPTPTLTGDGYFEVRRWRVNSSPAAPREPMSVPIGEYLPSVKVTWGLTRDRWLRSLSNRIEETSPVDPRIARIARKIIEPLAVKDEKARVAKLYAWVLDNVQEDDDESDGRRSIIGKRGNRWRAFTTLCRALDIAVEWAVARNRLAPPVVTASAKARQFNDTVLRIGTRAPTWLVVDDVPFGYLPARIRGAAAYVLNPEMPQEVVLPSSGVVDGVSYVLKGDLRTDGSASFTLAQTYSGRFAAKFRKGITQIAERQVHGILESKVLGLPGARLLSHDFKNLDNVNLPFIIQMKSEMSLLAQPELKTLRLDPPFGFQLGRLAQLPSRQTVMLFKSAREQNTTIRLTLPPGASVKLTQNKLMKFAEFEVEVADFMDGDTLVLKRRVVLPATRVAVEDYARFAKFARQAEVLLSQPITVQLAEQN